MQIMTDADLSAALDEVLATVATDTADAELESQLETASMAVGW